MLLASREFEIYTAIIDPGDALIDYICYSGRIMIPPVYLSGFVISAQPIIHHAQIVSSLFFLISNNISQNTPTMSGTHKAVAAPLLYIRLPLRPICPLRPIKYTQPVSRTGLRVRPIQRFHFLKNSQNFVLIHLTSIHSSAILLMDSGYLYIPVTVSLVFGALVPGT